MSQPDSNDRTATDGIEARVTDIVTRLVLLGLFLYLAFLLVRPFLPILVWAAILSVTLAPLHDWLVARLRLGRGLAATVISLMMLAMIIGPAAGLAASFVETVQVIVHKVGEGALRLPPLGPRFANLPLVGDNLENIWALASGNLEAFVQRYREVIMPIGAWALGLLSSVGFSVVRFALSIIVAGLLLVHGPAMADGGARVARRILAPKGETFVLLATRTIRNVSRGVVGVALIQSVLVGLILLLTGVPGAGLLAFFALILCILQIGPAPIVLPVLIWAWLSMTTAEAAVLTALLIPVTVMDNVLKPVLMKRGLTTPTVVILLGMIGGTLSFGLIGLFLGPVVMSVVFELLKSWVQDADSASGPEA